MTISIHSIAIITASKNSIAIILNRIMSSTILYKNSITIKFNCVPILTAILLLVLSLLILFRYSYLF